MSDGANLAGPGDRFGIGKAGVFGVVVFHGEALDRGRIDRDDVVVLAEGGSGADAVVKALFDCGEGQGKTLRAVGLFGDQGHALDSLGPVGEEPADLGAVEALVSHRNLDRDRFAFCDPHIAGIDHEGVGVGIADVEEGREGAGEERPRLGWPDHEKQGDDAAADRGREHEFF